MVPKLKVSRAALFARIKRKLGHEEERLYASRSERARLDVGDFYVLDLRRNLITASFVDPVELARELGVLKPFEDAEL